MRHAVVVSVVLSLSALGIASGTAATASPADENAPPPEAVFTAPGLGNAVSGWSDTAIAGGDEAVRVYRFGSDGWRHDATLTAGDGRPGDEFGAAVSLSGRFALVGAPGADVDGQEDAGAAYVYFRLPDGTWELHARLQAAAPAAGARFGSTVDSSAERFLIVSSPGVGLATVFEPVGPSNLPAITAELTAPDLTAAEAIAAEFGTGAAIQRGVELWAAVGAPGSDGSGAVHYYRQVGSSWVFDQKLVDDPRTVDGRFGETVAIESTAVVTGAPGSRTIVGLNRNPATGDFVFFGRDEGGPGFGGSVGNGNGRAIAGDPSIRAAHVYGGGNGGVLFGSVVPAGGTPSDGFGTSVDVFLMDPHRIAVVGAPGSESIHLFNLDGLSIPEVLPGAVELLEGDEGATIAQVPVALSEPSVRTVTVDWVTADHTATEPDDYEPATGTVTFAPGETETTVPVTVKGDLLPEVDEIALVSFRDPAGATLDKGASIGGFYGLGFVTITDDDPEPRVVPWIDFAAEGDSGTTQLDVPVRLSSPSGAEVTVDWVTFDLTAQAPGDYVAAAGTVVFAPGQTEGVATVDVVGDEGEEFPESFIVSFRNPTGAKLGGFFGLGAGVILDDD